jgi:tRNA-modifying protein YgfZ
MTEMPDDYRTLTERTGMVDFAERTRLEVTGPDRASFLHNLSTNDVKRLSAGEGCEAFFLDARGHVLAHVFLICRGESIVIEGVAGQGEPLLKHLNRYLIREKVELHDRTNDWGEVLVAGAESPAVLAKMVQGALPTGRLANVESELAGQRATIVRVDFTQPGGYLVLLDSREAQCKVTEALESHGAVACGRAALEAARIEAAFPSFGQDITEKNLPQEVDRDAQAISFNKGCYLGQETVARIDALGHVNKTLVRVRFEGDRVPSPGTELMAGDLPAGQITSAVLSPKFGLPLALAYIRRGSNVPGTALTSVLGPAVVIDGGDVKQEPK